MTKWKKNDALLLLAVIAAALMIWGVSALGRREGGYAVVTVDGEEWGRYPLSRPAEIEIATAYGVNSLVIADGKAGVTDADCPDRLCVSQKDIRYEGETIVCLPHKLIVRIEGGTLGELDGVAD